MKRCPYCNAEYPDDASACSIDGFPLPESIPIVTVAEQTSGSAEQATADGAVVSEAQAETAGKDSIYLTYPNYKWSARDAWKCVGMMLVFQFVLDLILFTLDRHFVSFYFWRATGVGFFLTALLFYVINLLTAAYFARTESLASFWDGFGLDRKPTDYAWFGVVAAICINFFGHCMRINGWARGVTSYDINAFKHTIGPEKYLFLVPLLLLAPLFEESIYRGFLYKAFRGSFAVVGSMIFVLAWMAYIHWWEYRQSLLAAFDISMLTIVQCYLREKSDSLWDCILCHLAFNGSGLLIYGVFRQVGG